MRVYALASLLVLAGCAHLEQTPTLFERPPLLPTPPLPQREVVEPFEGSLWRGEDSRHFLAFENRATRVGDLVSVVIVEQADAANEAKTELDRESAFAANIDSDISLQTIVSRPILNLLGFLGFTDQNSDKNPSGNLNVIDAGTKTEFSGEGKLERSASFTTKIACVVIDRTPSGLLYIEGERHLAINGETQVIRLTGFVRPEDIRIDNTLPSELIASADIRYGGVGLVSEEQRVPWLTRIMSLVLPF